MACIKSELCTKDKKKIDAIYKKLKRYSMKLNLHLPECTGNAKDCEIKWIDEAYNHKEILKSIFFDITINEYCNIEKEYKYRKCSIYNHSTYWQNMGLVYSCYDDYFEELKVGFVDEAVKFFDNISDDEFEEMGIKATINSIVSSMVNLYGIISFDKAYEIFCGITSLGKKIDFEYFIQTAKSFCEFREEYNITVFLTNFVSCDYVDIYQMRGLKKIIPKPSYYELICKQGDKPFFTNFTIEKILCYEYPGSYEIDSYIDEFMLFLSNEFKKSDKMVFELADEVCKACAREKGINDIFELMDSRGFSSKSQKTQKMLVKHVMQIKNNVRLRTNRGFSINELRTISYEFPIVCENL